MTSRKGFAGLSALGTLGLFFALVCFANAVASDLSLRRHRFSQDHHTLPPNFRSLKHCQADEEYRHLLKQVIEDVHEIFDNCENVIDVEDIKDNFDRAVKTIQKVKKRELSPIFELSVPVEEALREVYLGLQKALVDEDSDKVKKKAATRLIREVWNFWPQIMSRSACVQDLKDEVMDLMRDVSKSIVDSNEKKGIVDNVQNLKSGLEMTRDFVLAEITYPDESSEVVWAHSGTPTAPVPSLGRSVSLTTPTEFIAIVNKWRQAQMVCNHGGQGARYRELNSVLGQAEMRVVLHIFKKLLSKYESSSRSLDSLLGDMTVRLYTTMTPCAACGQSIVNLRRLGLRNLFVVQSNPYRYHMDNGLCNIQGDQMEFFERQQLVSLPRH